MEKTNNLKEKLIEKLDKEYENFLVELRENSFETLIERAYEIMSKQEIKDYIEFNDLEDYKIKALLKHENILEDLYDEWLGTDGNFYNVMEDSINDRIEEITKEYSKKLNKNNKER